MHCLPSEWGVLSFTNMLLMYRQTRRPAKDKQLSCLSVWQGKWIPIMQHQQHQEAREQRELC